MGICSLTWYSLGITNSEDGFELYHPGFTGLNHHQEFIEYEQNIKHYKFNLKNTRKRLINQCSILKQNVKHLSRQLNGAVTGYTKKERLSELYCLSDMISKHHRVTIWIRAITMALNYLNNKPFTYGGEKHYSDFKPRYAESILTSDYSKWSIAYDYYYGLEMALGVTKILLKIITHNVYQFNQSTPYLFLCSNRIKMVYCHQKEITVNNSAPSVNNEELKFENWVIQTIND